jgi:anti-anti-sigma factor
VTHFSVTIGHGSEKSLVHACAHIAGRRLQGVETTSRDSILLDESNASALSVLPQSDGRRVVLRLVGDLDIATGGQLFDAAAELSPPVGGHVCADLSDLNFVDAAGLAALHAVHSLVVSRGGHLVVAGARPMTRRLLAITGLDDVLEITN